MNKPVEITPPIFFLHVEKIKRIIIGKPFHKKLANDNLRYIDWNSRNGSSPVILDESDFSNLISSDKLFARKFENPISAGIVAKLKQHFNQLNPNEVI